MKNEKPQGQLKVPLEQNEDSWLDKQDILARMHISSRTLQTWRSNGILPYCRIGKKIFYLVSDLKKLFARFMRNH